MRPTPLSQKLPIAPIFIADKVSLAVFARKGREIAPALCRMGRCEGCSAGDTRRCSPVERLLISLALGDVLTRRISNDYGLERHSRSSISTHDPSARVAAECSAHLNGGR